MRGSEIIFSNIHNYTYVLRERWVKNNNTIVICVVAFKCPSHKSKSSTSRVTRNSSGESSYTQMSASRSSLHSELCTEEISLTDELQLMAPEDMMHTSLEYEEDDDEEDFSEFEEDGDVTEENINRLNKLQS